MTKKTKMLSGSLLALSFIFLGFQNFDNITRPNDMYMHFPRTAANRGDVTPANLNCEAFSRAVNYCTLASADTLVQIEDVNGELHAYHCDKAIELYRVSTCMQRN